MTRPPAWVRVVGAGVVDFASDGRARGPAGRAGPCALAAVAGTLLVGCGAFGPAAVCPARGGPPWREIRSAHFVVRTDADEAAALEALTETGKAYAVLNDVAFPDLASAPATMSVVLFGSHREFEAFAARGVAGEFRPRLAHDLDAEPTMLMPAGFGELGRVVFTHELTHAFVHRAYGWAPTWLNEGLADYFSTLRLEEGRVVLGLPAPGRLAPPSMLPSARDVVRADRATFYGGRGGGDWLEAERTRQLYYAGG